VLGADSLSVIKTWVDAVYGVHDDFKSHTGGVMSLGHGVIACKLTKQKLNTKSSTEAKLIGATDYLPNTIWMCMFLEAQGYELRENCFFQDNQSTIKLEKNGQLSCGQKLHHIDICFLFMKGRIVSEKNDIKYCPTQQMLANFFMKPLQGALFKRFKRVIMGLDHISALADKNLVPSEEHVEKGLTQTVSGLHNRSERRPGENNGSRPVVSFGTGS